MARRDADDQSRSGAKTVAELLREAGRVNGPSPPRRRGAVDPPPASSPFGGLPPDQRKHPLSEQRAGAERQAAERQTAERQAAEAERARQAQLEADFQSRLEAEERTHREALARAARERAQQQAAAREAARREAEETARREAEERARREAERAAAEAERRETERRERREAEERAVREAAVRAEAQRRAAIERDRRERLAALARQDDRAPSWFTLSEFAPGDPRDPSRAPAQPAPVADSAQPAPVTDATQPAPVTDADRPAIARSAAPDRTPPPAPRGVPRAWPPDDSVETPSWLSQSLTDLTAPLPAVPAETPASGRATTQLAGAALAEAQRIRTQAPSVEEAATGPTPVVQATATSAPAVLPDVTTMATTPLPAEPTPAAAPATEPATAKRASAVHYLLALGELILAVALGLGLSYLFRQLWDFTPYVAAVAAPVAVCGLVGVVGAVRKRLHLGAVPLGLLLVILFVATLLVVLPAAWVISP